jgi:hypothetical protein
MLYPYPTRCIPLGIIVKVSTLSPEYLEDQLAGGPSHEPRASHCAHAEQTEHEMALARHFEEADRPLPPPPTTASSPLPLLPPPSPPPVHHHHQQQRQRQVSRECHGLPMPIPVKTCTHTQGYGL